MDLSQAVQASTEAKSIYESSAWSSLRREYETRRDWYDGVEWRRRERDLQDPVTGGPVYLWPLQLNPIAKVCRIHRAVMLGMQDEIVKDLPIRTLAVKPDNLTQSQKDAVDKAQQFVNDIWYMSHGVSSQFEACLLMQIYGGHVFKVAWSPWRTDWSHRIGIQSLKTPAFFYPVVYDPFDPWILHDAYIGYKISPKDAQSIYGVTVAAGQSDVTYLEHWTTSSYEITVDGKVPTMIWQKETIKFSGTNPWGVVPIVYIPHDIDGNYYGRSVVDGDSSLLGLAKELNARMADIGDSVQDARATLVGRNMRATGSLRMREVIKNGKAVMEVLDIGDAKALTGAKDPDLFYIQPSGIPKAEAAYAEDIMTSIYRQADIARVATGDDDVSGGRITGPVTAYRMWPTMQHTMAERAHFTVGMSRIAYIIMVMAEERERSGAFRSLGIEPPGFQEDVTHIRWGAAWKPMIPIEKSQKLDDLNKRLKAGGISLQAYLKEIGVQDVDSEMERIWEDRKRQAELDSLSKPAPFGGQPEGGPPVEE